MANTLPSIACYLISFLMILSVFNVHSPRSCKIGKRTLRLTMVLLLLLMMVFLIDKGSAGLSWLIFWAISRTEQHILKQSIQQSTDILRQFDTNAMVLQWQNKMNEKIPDQILFVFPGNLRKLRSKLLFVFAK